ncbi:hypothetical protein B0H13DRAFT_137168 [Mycena leptocephala]|nr:hypothetical protein B0H13DRAFT_137168 [Mycena leptocephala]
MSRPVPRPVQNATPDGRAFSTNSRIVIPRLSNPEVYSRPTVEAYPSRPHRACRPHHHQDPEEAQPQRRRVLAKPSHPSFLYTTINFMRYLPLHPQTPSIHKTPRRPSRRSRLGGIPTSWNTWVLTIRPLRSGQISRSLPTWSIMRSRFPRGTPTTSRRGSK